MEAPHKESKYMLYSYCGRGGTCVCRHPSIKWVTCDIMANTTTSADSLGYRFFCELSMCTWVQSSLTKLKYLLNHKFTKGNVKTLIIIV